MINLLPKNGKAEVVRIYHLRVATVAAGAFFAVAVIATALLLPSYFLLAAKAEVVEGQLAALAKSTSRSRESLGAIVGDIRTKLAVFPDTDDPFVFSSHGIESVIDKRPPGVVITDFRYERKPDGKHSVSIGGTARSREALQKFFETLKSDPKHVDVALPLSNFIQGSDIGFSLTFTGAKP